VTGQEAAWLTVALQDLRVRDDAWARMDPAHQAAHQRLWTDLTRRARPGYVPVPASLLALANSRYGQVLVHNKLTTSISMASARNQSYPSLSV
jgi:hypothetical protein